MLSPDLKKHVTFRSKGSTKRSWNASAARVFGWACPWRRTVVRSGADFLSVFKTYDQPEKVKSRAGGKATTPSPVGVETRPKTPEILGQPTKLEKLPLTPRGKMLAMGHIILRHLFMVTLASLVGTQCPIVGRLHPKCCGGPFSGHVTFRPRSACSSSVGAASCRERDQH